MGSEVSLGVGHADLGFTSELSDSSICKELDTSSKGCWQHGVV